MKFRTLLTISGICLCSTPIINAQETQSPWTFGVKAGVNLSTFKSDGTTLSSMDGTTGFNGGVTVEYALRNNFFLHSGLEFTTKGADYYTAGPLNSILPENGDPYWTYRSISDSRRFKYLQLPLTLGYRLPVSKDVNITFNAGAYLAIGLSGKGTQQTWVTNIYADGETNTTYEEGKTSKKGDADYGLIGGVGLEYKKFSLNANYEYGLSSLATARNSEGINMGETWRNRNLTFSVGYKF
ncbi:porin family protein [Dysgonomonas sp. GY617]|uniref:porin family protein n=1 Tax=Dysgonomonas sp. GY617 TaxID=2780420 RepID=UPI001884671B|nr:porin family protein [Dysgonomonas sp. GY617]MBF0574561.1 PorT family protein [Dysgonomonas sp. GY617]